MADLTSAVFYSARSYASGLVPLAQGVSCVVSMSLAILRCLQMSSSSLIEIVLFVEKDNAT